MSVLNVKGDTSQGYCWFRPIQCWGRYLVPLTIQTMRRWRYEADIKQISFGSTTHNIFSAIFAGIALKLEKDGQIFKFQSMSILAIHYNRRQETVSKSKYGLK